MRLSTDITSISTQICALAVRVSAIAGGIESTNSASDALKKVYEQQLVDEVRHLQTLTIELTKTVFEDEPTQYVQSDGDSAFAQGELTSVIEPKEEEEE